MASNVPMHRPAPADAEKCSVCAEDGRPDELADVWCVQCQRSLCSFCVPHHSRYNSSHVTMAVQQIANRSEVLQAERHQCSVHGRPLEPLRFDCMLAKSTDCFRLSQSLGHASSKLLKEPQSEAVLADAKTSIKRLQMLVLDKSKMLVQSKDRLREVQSARAIHLDQLKTKKKSTMDALSESHEKAESALKEMHDRLHESAPGLQCLAEQLEQSIQHACKCVSSLTDMSDGALFLDQQAKLISRLEALSDELDCFKALPNIDQLVTLNGSLPENMNEIVDSWMGSLKLSTDLGRVLAEVLSIKAEAEGNTNIAQRQQLHFGPASSSFRLPFECHDLSVTSEGHVLLAAGDFGMRELDMGGKELSFWGCTINESVTTVAALDDGRAAVGMFTLRVIVLLQRSSADRAAWLVERRVAELQLPPRQLSVLGDVVAVALFTQNVDIDGYKHWGYGPQLQLVMLSTGQLLYRDSREYDIHSVALTAAGVVTTSWAPLKLSDGREVDVVDCCSHRGERLWRHVLSDKDGVAGVCAAPAKQLLVCVLGGSEVGVTPWKEWWSKDCVRAIDGEDGKNVEDVLVNSSHGVVLPMRLSLSRGQQQQQVLAVLSGDKYFTSKWIKVTVYTAVSS